jgi:glutamine amidotransferase
MIAIIDYKAGNLASVVKTLRFLAADDILVTRSPSDVLRADKIGATRMAVANGTPFLGICVGLQWLYEGSSEAPETRGLGHFAGQCERFPRTFEGGELKSPHVGWNSLVDIRVGSRLLAGVAPGSFVYYTHSWRAPLSADTAATTMYGGGFTAAVERGNVMGVQFHPEKSAETGLQVLRNFLAL